MRHLITGDVGGATKLGSQAHPGGLLPGTIEVICGSGGDDFGGSRNRRGLLGLLLGSEGQLGIGGIAEPQDGKATVFAGLVLDRGGFGATDG